MGLRRWDRGGGVAAVERTSSRTIDCAASRAPWRARSASTASRTCPVTRGGDGSRVTTTHGSSGSSSRDTERDVRRGRASRAPRADESASSERHGERDKTGERDDGCVHGRTRRGRCGGRRGTSATPARRDSSPRRREHAPPAPHHTRRGRATHAQRIERVRERGREEQRRVPRPEARRKVGRVRRRAAQAALALQHEALAVRIEHVGDLAAARVAAAARRATTAARWASPGGGAMEVV